MKPIAKKFLFYIIVFVVCLTTVELILRMLGYAPGYYLNQSKLEGFTFEKFDSTRLIPFLTVGEDGVLMPHNITDTANVSYISRQQFAFLSLPKNEFGFRNDWQLADTAKKQKIMLLGDSFTWGFDAEPADSSFASRLKQAYPNAGVFNMGLSGTDLATYVYLAEKWIPKIKPTVCVVNFFVNDYLFYDKKPIPYFNQDVYLTSSGVFFATNPDSYDKDSIEVFKDYRQAQKYMTHKFFYQPKNGFQRFLSKTVIGTLLSKPFIKPAKVDVVKFKKDLSSNENHLGRLMALCKAYHIKLVLSYIPDNNNPNNVTAAKEQLKKGFPKSYTLFNLPINLTTGDYNKKPKWHFNNGGHFKYFKHINALILKAQ